MGLAVLLLRLALFLGAHVFVTRRAARAALIGRIGEWPYKGLFALVSILGLALIVWGFADYRAAGPLMVRSPPGLAAPPDGPPDGAGDDLRDGRLYPGRHQADPQASDAGRDQAVGGRPPDREQRPRSRPVVSTRRG